MVTSGSGEEYDCEYGELCLDSFVADNWGLGVYYCSNRTDYFARRGESSNDAKNYINNPQDSDNEKHIHTFIQNVTRFFIEDARRSATGLGACIMHAGFTDLGEITIIPISEIISPPMMKDWLAPLVTQNMEHKRQNKQLASDSENESETTDESETEDDDRDRRRAYQFLDERSDSGSSAARRPSRRQVPAEESGNSSDEESSEESSDESSSISARNGAKVVIVKGVFAGEKHLSETSKKTLVENLIKTKVHSQRSKPRLVHGTFCDTIGDTVLISYAYTWEAKKAVKKLNGMEWNGSILTASLSPDDYQTTAEKVYRQQNLTSLTTARAELFMLMDLMEKHPHDTDYQHYFRFSQPVLLARLSYDPKIIKMFLDDIDNPDDLRKAYYANETTTKFKKVVREYQQARNEPWTPEKMVYYPRKFREETQALLEAWTHQRNENVNQQGNVLDIPLELVYEIIGQNAQNYAIILDDENHGNDESQGDNDHRSPSTPGSSATRLASTSRKAKESESDPESEPESDPESDTSSASESDTSSSTE